MKIEIDYDGKWPVLCMGHLIVYVDGEKWDFGKYSLSSGGSVTFDSHWKEHIKEGSWKVREDAWPDGFPEEQKREVEQAINEQIPHGCCGGCV